MATVLDWEADAPAPKAVDALAVDLARLPTATALIPLASVDAPNAVEELPLAAAVYPSAVAL